ncbi:MAG: glyoxylate/hydroxypyruvate reductase A [Burkholderiales bacterium]|nr:glyoxylate/hydroxypyruvate reductase A [Burkholderiales bacterium]
MSILVLPTSKFVEQQLDALRAAAPALAIHTDPAAAPADLEAIHAFRLPAGIAPRFHSLRFVASAGAGVDEILACPDLPARVPIVRPVDPIQGTRLAQYVAMAVLRHARELPRYEAQQRAGRWIRLAHRDESSCAVGLMGCGALGAPVAAVLRKLGYPLAVWTTSGRAPPGARAYAGDGALEAFLARSHVLVCLLPLTARTRGLVGARTLSRLPRDAYVIGASRGGIIDEEALLAAIETGRLAGAAFDVYAAEPLPADNPLWRHPQVLCTPHVAAMPRPEVVAAQLLDNLSRAREGRPLVRLVDRDRGY